MPVFKNKTQGQYVNVYKDILKNHSLSLRDREMVVTLLSLPDNWEFTISGLSKISRWKKFHTSQPVALRRAWIYFKNSGESRTW